MKNIKEQRKLILEIIILLVILLGLFLMLAHYRGNNGSKNDNNIEKISYENT